MRRKASASEERTNPVLGRQWFPWIHIDDVVNGYLFALENQSLAGPVNLTAPHPVRVTELAREIGRALHRPSLLPAPGFGLRILLGEMSDVLLKGQKVIPARLKDAGFTFRFSRLPEALEDVLKK